MFIATLVAPDALAPEQISAAVDAVGGQAGEARDGVACSIRCSGDPLAIRDRLEALPGIDVFVRPAGAPPPRLFVADMDSTMITCECIDELADYVGAKEAVAAVTERAMRGEIDFAGALRDRVALLAGLPEDTLAACLAERVRAMPGAVELLADLRGHGVRCVLVSGGFTHFAQAVRQQLGFDRVVANRLIVRDGRLTGETEQPIVDAQTKRSVLLEELDALAMPPAVSVAIGDGANDIPMIEEAGFGIAYRAKPKAEAAADARVRHGNLHAVRYGLGLA